MSVKISTDNLVEFEFQRFATLTCDLEPEKGAVIEAASGVRSKIDYVSKNSRVTLATPPSDHTSPGVVTSGGDWVFVRTDGVIFIDARMTIAFKPDKPGEKDEVALVDATLKGAIDLCKTFGIADGEAAFREYDRGKKDPVLKLPTNDFHHKITGSFRFEVGKQDDPWISKNFIATGKAFEGLAPLVRQQFLAVGTVTIDVGQRYSAKAIAIEAWGII